ncbi:MAG: HAMP domain-containing histidine kinase, partial [Alphaproteobacteria bacterium]|nr:HAMP domain-containing histidine kinase [Alphaproteobacteria bacterium]
DDGLGLALGAKAAAFESFYSTKLDNGGTGLGLFISRQIVEEAGGAITLDANPAGGATLDIELIKPLASP